MSSDPVVALCELLARDAAQGISVLASSSGRLPTKRAMDRAARALLVAWEALGHTYYPNPDTLMVKHDHECPRCRILAIVEGRDA